MLAEILYMQVRLFRMFREKTGLTARQSIEVFNAARIWEFNSDVVFYKSPVDGHQLLNKFATVNW